MYGYFKYQLEYWIVNTAQSKEIQGSISYKQREDIKLHVS